MVGSDMARMTPSGARRARAAIPQTRITPTRSARQTLRSRFRSVRPIVSRWTNAGRGPTSSPSRIQLMGSFSNVPEARIFVGVDQEQLERWADIEAGHLPQDDETPQPPTADEVAERESEALADIEARGRAREEQIREDTAEQVAALNAQADDVAETTGPARRNALRRASRLRNQADDAATEGRQQMAQVAEQVREQRDEARSNLRQQVEAATTAADERLVELKSGLKNEIERAFNEKIGSDRGHGNFDLESWDIA